ncbi:unnamed protein product, partial [Owenia fusiformis]
KAYHEHLADEIESQLCDQTVYLTRSNINIAYRLACKKIHERSSTTKDSLKEIWQLANKLINLERLDEGKETKTTRFSYEDVSLSGVHIKALTSCQDSLVKSLNVRSMADIWYQENVITKEMKEDILSEQTNTRQCTKFLELLKMRSTYAFNKFVSTLKDTNDTNKTVAIELELCLWEYNLIQTKDNLALANYLVDQNKKVRSLTDFMAIKINIEKLMEQCNIQDSQQLREKLKLPKIPEFEREEVVLKRHTFPMQSTGNFTPMDQTFQPMPRDLWYKLLQEIQEAQLKRRNGKADSNDNPSSMKLNKDDVE